MVISDRAQSPVMSALNSWTFIIQIPSWKPEVVEYQESLKKNQNRNTIEGAVGNLSQNASVCYDVAV